MTAEYCILSLEKVTFRMQCNTNQRLCLEIVGTSVREITRDGLILCVGSHMMERFLLFIQLLYILIQSEQKKEFARKNSTKQRTTAVINLQK